MILNKTKKLVITALMIAFGVILPILFHTIPDAGRVLLPMHIPVLICGLMCGGSYGLLCGIITPIMSSLLTGMPPAAYLPGMVCELAVYGLVAGLVISLMKNSTGIVSMYISLITAMVAGRLVIGVLNSFIFSVGEYSMAIWVSSMFVKALPGILLQLIVIPILIKALTRTRIYSSTT